VRIRTIDRLQLISEFNLNFFRMKKRIKKSTQPLSAKECILAVLSTVCLTSVCTAAVAAVAAVAAANQQGISAAAARLYTEMHFFSAIIIVITCHSITNTIRPLLPVCLCTCCL
jgi:hypothetical protein